MFFEPKDAKNFTNDQHAAICRTVPHGLVPEGKVTVENAGAILDYIAMQAEVGNFPWYKGIRPHDFVPEIVKFKVKEGDYSIGLEIENAVQGGGASRKKLVAWLRPKPYVCVDKDGNGALFEATFPPIAYSEIDENWLGYQYVKFIGEEKLVCPPPVGGSIGIHINIGGNQATADKWHRYLTGSWSDEKLNKKYFGRGSPYGTVYTQSNKTNRWLEMKMFNTTTDPKMLLWYVEAAKVILDFMEANVAPKRPSNYYYQDDSHDKRYDECLNIYPLLEEAHAKFWAVTEEEKPLAKVVAKAATKLVKKAAPKKKAVAAPSRRAVAR